MTAPIYYAIEREHLAVERVGDELLIYDRRSDVAHCLGKFAACVWSRCQGGASLNDLIRAVAQLTDAADGEALVLTALAELQDKDLLQAKGGAAVSRRAVLKRLAAVGAAATIAPLVVSAAVPKPADAAVSPGGTCHTTGGSCFNPMTPPSALNGCCANTTMNANDGYYCGTGTPTTATCGQCIPGGDRNFACTAMNKFMCCSGACGGSGKCG